MIVVKCDKCLVHVAVLVCHATDDTGKHGWIEVLTVRAEKDCCKAAYELMKRAMAIAGIKVREVK